MPVVFLNSKAFCKLEPVFELAYCNVPEYSDPIKKVVIDRNKIYHCGTSINYIGSKTFSINILEDEIVKE